MPGRVSGEAAWRRSRIVQAVTSPAAGADWSQTVPASHLWQLFSITATLTTSAVVANRQVRLVLTDGTNTFASLTAAAVQAASLANVYTWCLGQHPLALGLQQLGALPELTLPEAWTVGVSTLALDAGDQWSAIRLGILDTTARFGDLDLMATPELIVGIVGMGASADA